MGEFIALVQPLNQPRHWLFSPDKHSPAFDALSFLYYRERSRVSRRYNVLAHILESALGRRLALPKRQIVLIEELSRAFPEAEDVSISE